MKIIEKICSFEIFYLKNQIMMQRIGHWNTKTIIKKYFFNKITLSVLKCFPFSYHYCLIKKNIQGYFNSIDTITNSLITFFECNMNRKEFSLKKLGFVTVTDHKYLCMTHSSLRYILILFNRNIN
ncbi:hypothetical protein BpHYR1_012877 [Brachionus plicatilis]|uniref:Uncharacterized protein n=1 Tax=Brachionus plicatilis TaxID=10195 RepID=A0A3M7QFQ9_BRAPC|nr:hypothetical protein BpHYR1_012877 [Brachionus plicatilis]